MAFGYAFSSLAEIKRLLDLSEDTQVPCEEVDRMVAAHLERVRARRLALEALEARLTTLKAQCARSQKVANCGILASWFTLRRARNAPVVAPEWRRLVALLGGENAASTCSAFIDFHGSPKSLRCRAA